MSELEPFWRASLAPEEKRAFEGIQSVLQRSLAAELSGQRIAQQTAIPEIRQLSNVLGTRDHLPTRQEFAGSSESLGTQERIKHGNGQRLSLNQRTRPGPASAPGVVEPYEYDRRAVAFAMEHLFERRSVVSEKRLMAEAFPCWCIGKATKEGIARVVAETPLIRVERDNRLMVTTWEILAEENRIIDGCKNGKWKCASINPSWRIQDTKLNEQQRDAVWHAVSSRDRVVGIGGRAGTGKTALIHEITRATEASGHRFLLFAPGAEAARDTLRKDGFANAETVARLLENSWVQRQARGAVLCVDEAGLLSTRQADRLLRLADELDARLILLGDVGQHHSVERGQAFDLLQRRGEMCVAFVDEALSPRTRALVLESDTANNTSAITEIPIRLRTR